MNSLNSTILPLTYLGNIFYYIHLIKGGCTIDINSHYIKQTYTNRCSIITANGVQDLTIPVIKPKEKTAIKDIRISSHDNWQQLHWRAIQSAYNSTPFFEYFLRRLPPFLPQKMGFSNRFQPRNPTKNTRITQFPQNRILAIKQLYRNIKF